MTLGKPRVNRLFGQFGCALTIDVEEWYHTCLVPDYVDPEQRPALRDELDRLLPELLDTLAEAGRSATFFVLGEVAERLPRRVREIADAGHEVGSHGYLHFRACDRSPEAFRSDLERSKKLLEDVTGTRVLGFRAPEWSLRSLASPCLPLVAEAGFLYDSSLAPYPLSGTTTNPRLASRLTWDRPGRARELLEIPPLTFGPYLRIPTGSWPGRLVRPSWVADAAEEHLEEGGLPVVVIHPWEVSGRPTPGRLKGFAWFCHETGRLGFQARFQELLHALPWSSIRDAMDLGQSGRKLARSRGAMTSTGATAARLVG
ncbi:MAG TPA: polysaccharide deacetylase family protein [Thermoanaerobaculia bacterium]|nr:polysaccharide deacetylase family protein [Thermoanaerobaculia bacterium]